MIFKKGYLSKEYERVTDGTKAVVQALDSALESYGTRAKVTCVFRTRAEQEELAKQLGIPFKESVHTYWRGVDCVPSKALTDEQCQRIADFVSEKVPYSPGAGGPTIKSCIWHAGTAMHFHCQRKF